VQRDAQQLKALLDLVVDFVSAQSAVNVVTAYGSHKFYHFLNETLSLEKQKVLVNSGGLISVCHPTVRSGNFQVIVLRENAIQ